MRPITAGDLMNPEILTVDSDLTVRELASFLVENEISGAPVRDREGRIVGVVSLFDLAAVASDGEDGVGGAPDEPRDGLIVADIMTPVIHAVTEDATVPEVAAAMLKGHLHRLLVTRDDRAVGIVSTSDLLGLLITTEE